MQKFTRFLLICMPLLLASNWLSAQVEVSHKDDWFFIEPGTNVHIKGNLHSLENNSFDLSNLGGMFISDSIKSNGLNRIFGFTPDTVTANVYLNGDKKQWIVGNEIMRFGNLHLRNSADSLEALQNVEIYNLIQIDSGNLKLRTVTLDLLNTGRMQGETNEKRIFSNEYGQIRLNRFLQSGATYNNMYGTGLDLSINGNLGSSVEVFRTNSPQPNASNGSIERYYSFDPQQNGFVSQPAIHYLDSNELNGSDENKMGMYISQSSASTWLFEPSSVDVITDKVSSDPNTNFVLQTSTMLTVAEKDCDSLPFIQFQQDTIPLCAGMPAYLKPLGIEGMQSEWSNGIVGQDSIQVTQAGTYYVTITNLAGCPNTDSVVVISAPDPVVDYALSPVCVGDTTFFINNSTITSGSMTYFWSLGDPFTRNPDTTRVVNPEIVYTNQGTFTTNLVVTSNYGCTQSLSKNSIAKPYPVIDVTLADNCADTNLAIINNTTVTPNAGITYSWDFDQQDTLTGSNPNFAFASNGLKLVTVEATSNGCTAQEVKTVNVGSNPVASFNAPNVCVGNATTFTNTSTISMDSIISYTWTFESGSNTSLSNPNYTFTNEGTYAVQLRATSINGCVHDTIVNVVVDSLPTPTFTTTPTCIGDSTPFVNGGATSSTYVWDFNGEGSSNSIDPMFEFSTSGAKVITLTETNVNGCVNSIANNITAKPRPVADFTFQAAACETDIVTFNNASSTPSGNISYQWDFKNGSTSTQANPNETFNLANNYNIQLVAEVNGCADTTNKNLIVNSKPVVGLGGNITTCANAYTFDALNTGASYLWSNNSTAQTLMVGFGGQYSVTVTNSSGCSTSDTVQLTLNSMVMPNLGADATFCDETTLDAGYPGSTYLWSTGETSQTIDVLTTNQYFVQVTDQNGCIGSDTINATVATSVLPQLGADVTECDGIVTTLDPTNNGASYLWNTLATTKTIDVTTSGLYFVELTDGNGCISSDTINVTYNPTPALDLGADGQYCDSVNFDVTQPGVSYLWNDNSTNPIRTINSAGDYNVTLTDNTTGCISADSINVTLAPKPIVNLGIDTSICSGATLVLDAANQINGTTYLWNVGNTTQTITAAATGSYSVLATSPSGCVGTDTIQLTISSPLNTFLGEDFVLCAGTTAQLSSPIAGANYQWYFDGTLSTANTQTITVSQNGEYAVNVTDNLGCMASDTIQLIQTGSNLTADFLASTVDVNVGDTLKLINLSFPSGFNSNWDFGDGSFSIAEDPTHIFLTEGPKNIRLTVSNGTCSSDTMKSIMILPLRKRSAINEIDSILNSFDAVNLFPNPNNGNYQLAVELLEEGELFIELYNINGQRLFEERLYGKEFNLHYNNERLGKGIYLIRMRVNEEYRTLRFIKT